MSTGHSHDLPADDEVRALAESQWPELLRELMEISREIFGFYTRHYPSTINYPWLASRLQALAEKSRVLDIGSGLGPVPVFLARRGMHVDCVDDSDLIRTPPTQDDWNEWGYFDYGRLHNALTSYHSNILKFETNHRYDAIYSLCVLAHMTAAERRATWRRCKALLKRGGRLLLAIDLIRSTDYVWNIAQGLEFEPRRQHGTVYDLQLELAAIGFGNLEIRVKRNIFNSRTDLAFIVVTA